jgi:hypothetical protein
MKTDLLTRILVAPDTASRLSAREWETLLGQARRSRLLSRLAVQLSDSQQINAVAAGPEPYLRSALDLAERQRHEVIWEVNCIARALAKLDTPVVLLKGAAYLTADLPPSKGRLFSDIDILVPRENIDLVEGALFAAGWLNDERDAYNQRYYRQWMHEIPPLRHAVRNTFIDLHHTITPPTSYFHVAGNQLLERIVQLEGLGGKLFVLAPTDMVLHSAVHLFQEGEFSHGLRDLLDLKDLLQHFAQHPDFWPDLFDRADKLGLQVPLFHALFHIQRLFGYAAPQQWSLRITQFAPPAPARLLMAWLLKMAIRPDHPSCDTHWTSLARWLLYVRSHALRMPLRLVIPHLIRKAWMKHFPTKTDNPSP